MEHPNPHISHDALHGLREITISDGDRYHRALARTAQRAWTNYFPFLVGLNASQARSILLGAEEGALCVYLLYHRPDRHRLHLYLPPLPLSPGSLASAFERMRAYNDDDKGRLLWINEAVKREIEAIDGYRLKPVDEEVVYAPATLRDLSGSRFRVLRYQLRRAQRGHEIVPRPFLAGDVTPCLRLLEVWRRSLSRKGVRETSFSYTKACLLQFEQFDRMDLNGYVYEVAGRIRAFALGGRLSGDVGCSFVNISDHDHASLGYFSRYHFLNSMDRYDAVNDAGCMGLEPLMHVKMQLVPQRLETIYRARRSPKARRTMMR